MNAWGYVSPNHPQNPPAGPSSSRRANKRRYDEGPGGAALDPAAALSEAFFAPEPDDFAQGMSAYNEDEWGDGAWGDGVRRDEAPLSPASSYGPVPTQRTHKAHPTVYTATADVQAPASAPARGKRHRARPSAAASAAGTASPLSPAGSLFSAGHTSAQTRMQTPNAPTPTRPAFRALAYEHQASPPATYSEYYVGSPGLSTGNEAVAVQWGAAQPWAAPAGRRSRSVASRATAEPEAPASVQASASGRWRGKERDKDKDKGKGKEVPVPADAAPPARRLINIFVEDLRTGRNYIAEVRTHLLRPSSAGGFWAEADDLVTALQGSPSRIDGPAKVIVRRPYDQKGFLEHIILRVPAIVAAGHRLDTAKIPVHVDNNRNHLTLKLYVEHDPSGMAHSCTCGYVDKFLAEATRMQSVNEPPERPEKRQRRTGAPLERRRTIEMPTPEPSQSHSSRRASLSQRPSNSKVHARTTKSRSQESVHRPERSPSLSTEQFRAVQRSGNTSQGSSSSQGALNAGDEDSGEQGVDRYSDGMNEEPTPTRPQTQQPPPIAQPSGAFGAFGTSNPFSKYTQTTSAFGGFTNSAFAAPVRIPAPAGPPREKTEEEQKVDAAVVQYVRGELRRDPLWKRWVATREGNTPVRQQLEMYAWAEAQLGEWVGQAAPEDLEGAPGATVARGQVVRAMSFLPHRHEDILEEVLRLHECYGPSGTRGADEEAVALLDVEPAITPALQMESYLRLLRVADARWKEENE